MNGPDENFSRQIRSSANSAEVRPSSVIFQSSPFSLSSARTNCEGVPLRIFGRRVRCARPRLAPKHRRGRGTGTLGDMRGLHGRAGLGRPETGRLRRRCRCRRCRRWPAPPPPSRPRPLRNELAPPRSPAPDRRSMSSLSPGSRGAPEPARTWPTLAGAGTPSGRCGPARGAPPPASAPEHIARASPARRSASRSSGSSVRPITSCRGGTGMDGPPRSRSAASRSIA